MSPRDAELLAAAGARLRDASEVLDLGMHEVAVGTAYCAGLFAARAALSARDVDPKTHSGTWHLFHREFVRDGGFDEQLASQAAAAQHVREDVDYEARSVDAHEAAIQVDVAGRFVAAVAELLDT